MVFRISRRDVIAGLGFAATAPFTGIATAEKAALGWAPKGVTHKQATTLAAACECLIPETSTPGAGAFGVAQFIDSAINDWCTSKDAERIREGLQSLEEAAQSEYGESFADASSTQQVELLKLAEANSQEAQQRQEPHYFTLLRDLATVGYFQSEQGTTNVLRYDPIPGHYDGCLPLADVGRAWAL